MFLRQVKRKCSVRGCKCIDCFAISRTREVGNTVIICKSCLEKALGAIDEIDPKTKSNIPAIDNTAIPPLFFNAEALRVETETKADDVPSADDTSDTDAEETTPPESATEFKCPICDKTFVSDKGLKTHLRYCKPQTDSE